MTDQTMTCDLAREALWPDPSLPALAQAREHYDRCEACQTFFRNQAALGERLAHLTRPGAPDALRARIVARVAAERRAVRRRAGWAGVALAAAAALAITIGLRAPGDDDIAVPFVAQATRALPPANVFRSTQVGQVEEWLQNQIGDEVHVPDISDATILGGRVVELDGVPGVAAVYDYHGMPLTYFAVSTDEMAGRRMDIEAGIRLAAAQGYEVAIWAETSGLRAVAAQMPRAHVQAVAKECRDKAMLRPL